MINIAIISAAFGGGVLMGTILVYLIMAAHYHKTIKHNRKTIDMLAADRHPALNTEHHPMVHARKDRDSGAAATTCADAEENHDPPYAAYLRRDVKAHSGSPQGCP